MSNPARTTFTAPESQGAAGIGRARDGWPDPVDRVVALFSGPRPAPIPEADDWSASLTAVRGVATQVRALQTSARDAIREGQRARREAETAVRAAEERAEHAESLLREAIARGERAEAQARAAADRADRAEAQTAEARAWLRRMHECMVAEFGGLTPDTPEP